MQEQISQRIDEAVAEYRSELEQDYLEDLAIEKVKFQIETRVRLMIQEDLNINAFNNVDKNLLNNIKKEIAEKVDIILSRKEKKAPVEEEISLDNLSIEQVINTLEKESDETKKQDQKGNRNKATAKSGRLIKKIKNEIKKIKNSENVNAQDLESLEKLEVLLDNQLEWHKGQLKERYKNEFRKESATVKAIFTVLPKGCKIQTQRVVNCIRQLKEAKTNKERIFKVIELGKEIGLLAATPVIFTVKFIVKHWYLLLLLLLLLKFPHLGKPKGLPKTKDEVEVEYQPQEAVEPSLAYDGEEEVIKVPVPEGETVPKPVTNPFPKPDFRPLPGLKPVFAADAAQEPEVVAKPLQGPIASDFTEKAQAIADKIKNPNPVLAEPSSEIILDDPIKIDPVAPLPAPEPNAEIILDDPIKIDPVAPLPEQAPAVAPKPTPGPTPTPHPSMVEQNMPLIAADDLTEEQVRSMSSLVNNFLRSINQYGYCVGTRSDRIFVNSAEEFLAAAKRTAVYGNFSDKFTLDNARQYYIDLTHYTYRMGNQPIVWLEDGKDIAGCVRYFADETALADYIAHGDDPLLANYYQQFIATEGHTDFYAATNALEGSFNIKDLAAGLGVSSSVGLILFGLYELGKLALVPATGGASQILP